MNNIKKIGGNVDRFSHWWYSRFILECFLFTFLKKEISFFSRFELIGLKLYANVFVGVRITYVFYTFQCTLFYIILTSKGQNGPQ